MQDHNDRSLSRPLTDFILRLATSVQGRARDDLVLAKSELSSKTRSLAVGSLVLTMAAVFGVFGLLLLVVAGIAVLSLVMPSWGATLVFSAIVFLLASVLALVGKSRIARSVPLYPERTIEALKEDVRWMRAGLRS